MHFEVLGTSFNGDIFIVLLQDNNSKKRVKCDLGLKKNILLDFIPGFAIEHL